MTSVLTPAGTDTYRCDANGNTIGGGTTYGTTTKYDAANLPTAITRSSGSAQFLYDPLNRRAREFTTTDYTFFAGDGYERWGTTTNGVSRHELGPVVVTTQPTSGGTGTASHLFYELRDRLGSTLALVDDATPTPAGTQYRDYDAFGSVRNPIAGNLPWLPNGLNYLIDPAAPAGVNATLHGFTDHEHLDNVKLIHMNGRVYDYVLGRFLSVDPIIQNKANSQSLNPYSYIGNNPLSGTDPSGEVCAEGQHTGCTWVNTEKVAPTGSHIASNTKISGQASNGETTTTFSLTFDGGGKLLSSSINVTNGSQKQGSNPNAVQKTANDIGSASNRATSVTAESAAGSIAAVAGRIAGKAVEKVGESLPVVGGFAGQAASTAIGIAIPNYSIQSQEKERNIINAGLIDSAYADGMAYAATQRSVNNSAVIGETQDRVNAAAEAWGGGPRRSTSESIG